MENFFDPNKLEITDFKITKGEIDAPFDFDDSAILNFETNMLFDASFDADNKFVKADMGFEIESVSDNDQLESSAKFDFKFVFHVSNLEELIKQKNGKIIDINQNLIISIAAISFSTSRGILMTRLQGTAMKDYILPVIAPEKLLEE